MKRWTDAVDIILFNYVNYTSIDSVNWHIGEEVVSLNCQNTLIFFGKTCAYSFCWNILCCWFTYVGFLRVLIKFSCGILNSKQTFCCIIQRIARSYLFFWSYIPLLPKMNLFAIFTARWRHMNICTLSKTWQISDS